MQLDMSNQQKREKYQEAGYDDFCEAHQIPYLNECPECAELVEQRQLANDAGMSQADFDTQQQPGKILGWREEAQKRIAFLAQAEKNALKDIDGIPVGSHARSLSRIFIHELGHRKNELQDLLKKVPPEDLSVSASPVEEKGEDGLLTRMFQAQYGSREISKLIDEHIEEYFKIWHTYKDKLTYLEWYHLFLNFADKITESKPSPVIEIGEIPADFKGRIGKKALDYGRDLEKAYGVMYGELLRHPVVDFMEGADWTLKELAKWEASRPAPAPIVGGEPFKCPSCGKPWNTERHNACICGAILKPKTFTVAKYGTDYGEVPAHPAPAEQAPPEEIAQFTKSISSGKESDSCIIAACKKLYHKMSAEFLTTISEWKGLAAEWEKELQAGIVQAASARQLITDIMRGNHYPDVTDLAERWLRENPEIGKEDTK
ncbi:MAG TPA: hypothetical protein VGM31_14345 [Puia sp.]|jgi:hypothetical protein